MIALPEKMMEEKSFMQWLSHALYEERQIYKGAILILNNLEVSLLHTTPLNASVSKISHYTLPLGKILKRENWIVHDWLFSSEINLCKSMAETTVLEAMDFNYKSQEIETENFFSNSNSQGWLQNQGPNPRGPRTCNLYHKVGTNAEWFNAIHPPKRKRDSSPCKREKRAAASPSQAEPQK